MSPRSVITGGASFLGRHLRPRLLPKGHEVNCISNSLADDIRNIKEFLVHPRFTLQRVARAMDDPEVLQPIIGLARRELAWEPTVDFEGQLSRTLEYFRRLSYDQSRPRVVAVKPGVRSAHA